MDYYIQFKKANCKNCYKCIRHCPVKSIRFSDQQAHIVKEQCILCGECYVTCPQNAKEIRNDISKVKDLIATGRPIYASIAPAFVAKYTGITIKSMELALKQLGFTAVEETAIGATIVKTRYEEIIQEETKSGRNQVLISSCCHSINTLIQKYYPSALPYLANVISPMMAHCSAIKTAHPDAYTVFIGPCISKKEEAEESGHLVDCAITFEELTQWMEDENITFETDTPEISDQGRTRLFPITGGIIRSMYTDNTSYEYVSIDGLGNCMKALEDISEGKLSSLFIEMSACTGSCTGGPAMKPAKKTPVSNQVVINRYAKYKDFDITYPPKEELVKKFHYQGMATPMPGSSAINEILKKMGKGNPEQELNCSSCGYNTCREKALAVFQGKADLTMCLPYLKEKAENFSDNIIYNTPNGIFVLNESLEIQQINRAARQIFGIKHKLDILDSPVVRLLNPAIYLDVMESGRNVHDKLTYLTDYNKYIEETIIYDKMYHIIISIMRDVTAEVHAKRKKEEISKQTIAITDKVIEKQMRVVQEIASLLGETAAETKIALTNLKETLEDE